MPLLCDNLQGRKDPVCPGKQRSALPLRAEQAEESDWELGH